MSILDGMDPKPAKGDFVLLWQSPQEEYSDVIREELMRKRQAYDYVDTCKYIKVYRHHSQIGCKL